MQWRFGRKRFAIFSAFFSWCFFPKSVCRPLFTYLFSNLSFKHCIEPPSFVTEPESQEILPGSTVRLKTTFKGTAPFSVQWFKGDAKLTTGGACYIMTEAFSSYLELYAVKSSNSGVYSCKVSNTAGSIECSANLFVKGLHSLITCYLGGYLKCKMFASYFNFFLPLFQWLSLISQNLLLSRKGWSRHCYLRKENMPSWTAK